MNMKIFESIIRGRNNQALTQQKKEINFIQKCRGKISYNTKIPSR